MDGVSKCPECGSVDIEFEPVQALTFCQECGFVVSEVHLDGRQPFGGDDEQQVGVFVGAADDGTRAGAFVSGARTKALSPQVLRRAHLKLQSRLKALSGTLALPAAAQNDALGLLEQLMPSFYGRGKYPGDKLAGCALYIAARMHYLPLTIVDVSSLLRINAFAFGRLYRAACRSLEIALPATPVAVFLRATILKLCRDKQQQAAVYNDATALQSWLKTQTLLGTPLLHGAAALCIALESHKLKTTQVGKIMHMSDRHIHMRVSQVKALLVAAAEPLPFASSITRRNVPIHLQTILKLLQLQQQLTQPAAA